MNLKSLYQHFNSFYLNRLYSRHCNASISRNSLRKQDYKENKVHFGCNAIVYRNKISGNVSIGHHCWISNSIIIALNDTMIDIGRYSLVQGGQAQIVAKHKNNIKIGSFCTIGYGAMIVCHSHRTDTYTNSLLDKRGFGRPTVNISSLGDITIGHDCTLGVYSLVMPGVTLGNGCIISPNSVVTSSFEPYSIIAGNPAIRIGCRFSKKKIEYLEDLNWYEWEHDKIAANLHSLLKRVHSERKFN
jgi:acetyltransferase-like isoleucine patch superfamily enzyme